MKKRIYFSMTLLSVLSMLLLSGALTFVYYGQFSSVVRSDVRERAETFRDNSSHTATEALSITKSSDIRVTVVDSDGTVMFDNAAPVDTLPNHLDRPEIANAIKEGHGESRRFSDTLGQETYYYAVRLTDGYILRTAKTISSILGMFSEALPIVILAVVLIGALCYLAAGSLTKCVVAPINNVNPNGDLSAPYDELIPFIRTIAEQREYIAKQLADLKNRSDTIDAIMNNMNEGIILISKQGIILSANKSVLRIFEKDSSMDGRNILEFLRDMELLKYVRSALAGKAGEISMERGRRTYRVYFSHVSDRGAIILFLDITEIVKAEKIRREFSANVSHELKTPLTSIYGNAEMLHSGIVREDDKQEFYCRIKDEAGRMVALVEDIIMISRLDEGGGQELSEDVELRSVAAEAVKMLSQKAAENSVAIHITGENVVMWANRSMMYEMFYNLIDNAIKYNNPGGTVSVDIKNVENCINIVVSDTGIGIPKEAQSRVFERFFRIDKSRARKTGGTGLGLAIVKHIVLTHGGKIELQSQLDKGTTIIINYLWRDLHTNTE